MSAKSPNKKKLTKQEKKAKKAAKVEAKKKSDLAVEVVLAADGSLNQVTSKGFSFRGLQHQLVVAAGHFEKDYSSAYPLRCVGFEPGVDCAKAHAGYVGSVSAQLRLRDLRARIGERSYTILTAIVIGGFSTDDLHKMGGPQKVSIADQIRLILNDVHSFYSGRSLGPDKLLAAAHRALRQISFDKEPEPEDVRVIQEEAGRRGISRTRGVR